MNLLVGHLLGDYVFQSDWMAINKKKEGYKGFFSCFIHCLIWSICVYVFAFIGSPHPITTFLILFLSHFIIDRTSVIKGYLNTFKVMPNPSMWKIIIVDNTFHLLIIYTMYLFLK